MINSESHSNYECGTSNCPGAYTTQHGLTEKECWKYQNGLTSLYRQVVEHTGVRAVADGTNMFRQQNK